MANIQRSRRIALAGTAACALLAALTYAISVFPFQLVRTRGNAMAPTLTDERWLIVNKLTYRVRDPRAGEVVMMYSPLDPNALFVRRVIAREGDTIQIIAGAVYINGKPLSDNYVPSELRGRDDWGPQVVPAGYYFVLGDRRNASFDSRPWGFVPRRYIIGKIV